MTHKPTMRRLLSQAGIPQPAYEVVDAVADLPSLSVPCPPCSSQPIRAASVDCS